LGRSFSDDYIKDYLNRSDVALRYYINKLQGKAMAKKVAELLVHNEIVARCYGREEWGARALGNRSIICNPSDFKNINTLNKKVKNRDFWMPFTPSILAEDLDLYVLNPKGIRAPYMCITFDSTEKAKKEISAAIHPSDYTVRPQAVSKSWNPEYYSLIEEFKNITGISAVLNTSFNLHGEPNVGSPEDAIYTMDNSGLNYLVLGEYLVEKKDRK
jgi:carbamoyltransferase